jgi:hypothetical protein
MKHIFLIGLVLFISLLAGCGGRSAGSVVGKYKFCCREFAKGDAYLEFTKDGQVILYNKGIRPQGIGTYTIDESKSPMQMDINLSDEVCDKDGSSKNRACTVAAIYEFNYPNLLRIKLANFETFEGEKLINIRPNADFNDHQGPLEGGYRIWRCERVSSIPEEFQ